MAARASVHDGEGLIVNTQSKIAARHGHLIVAQDRDHHPPRGEIELRDRLLYAFIARQPAAASLRDPRSPAAWFGTPGRSLPSARISGCSS